ncbi:MFS transporter [Reichenbachiella versicolor]|uniref:MFS transporter n=1 Tax=Reichenbachiella versicolor TaxID=1821036 RepID=UPI001FE9E50D|nr:MFS transporter [Reichenbachiella versicolor]
MSLKYFLVLMTFVAVVSDYILHPFYPHFFADRFGVNSSDHVGYYFSSLCLVIMIAFPFWAYVSKKIAELRILILTQIIAGTLALCCYQIQSYLWFWILSLVMVMFKGSYLLIYPYALKVSGSQDHASTIGLLSVVLHLGGILGAVLGGVVLDFITPESAFIVMAIGDFIQMAMSAYLLKSSRYDTSMIKGEKQKSLKRTFRERFFILKIGLVTLILYFSDFIIRPFFTRYWEMVSNMESTLLTGVIYAIPAIVALVTLWYNSRNTSRWSFNRKISIALLVGIPGLFLQGMQNEYLIIIGRILYGWAIFQSAVQFDVLLFESSSPESYATDYSKVHFMQSLGVLIASTVSGLIVSDFGLQIPFPVSLIGFTLTLILFVMFILKSEKPVTDSVATA